MDPNPRPFLSYVGEGPLPWCSTAPLHFDATADAHTHPSNRKETTT